MLLPHQLPPIFPVKMTGRFGGSAAGLMDVQCVVEHGFELYSWLQYKIVILVSHLVREELIVFYLQKLKVDKILDGMELYRRRDM